MIPFVILLTVPIVITPFVKNIKINRIHLKYLPLFLFFVNLTILVMLRHKNVGNDTANYYYFVEKVSRESWSMVTKESTEVIFYLFMKVITMISSDPRFFIAVSGLLTSALLYPTYRRLCVDPPLTIVLFSSLSTFAMLFSGIRQMLAVGIGLIAYELVRRRKLILFVAVVVFAVFVHTSAFMLIFMYPLYHAKITKKWLFAVIPILAVVFIFNRQIFGVLSTFIEQYTDYNAKEATTGAYSTLIMFVLFTAFSYLIPDDSLIDEETNGLRNFMLLALVIQMFAPLNPVAMRMGYYYMIFIPLLVPKIIECSSVRFRKVAQISTYVLLVFFYLYFFIGATNGSKLHTIPYHFFWEYYII